jgi:hypothetical protein
MRMKKNRIGSVQEKWKKKRFFKEQPEKTYELCRPRKFLTGCL